MAGYVNLACTMLNLSIMCTAGAERCHTRQLQHDVTRNWRRYTRHTTAASAASPCDASPLALLPQRSSVRQQEDVSCCAGIFVVAGHTAARRMLACFASVTCCLAICCTLPQDTIKEARQQQIQATDLLARLLQAPDAKAIAAEHVDSLTEEFFIMSSTYLDMVRAQQTCLQDVLHLAVVLLNADHTSADRFHESQQPSTSSQARKEGNPDVSGKLEQVNDSTRHGAVARDIAWTTPVMLSLQAVRSATPPISPWLHAGHSDRHGREAEDAAARDPAAEHHTGLQFTIRATKGEPGID